MNLISYPIVLCIIICQTFEIYAYFLKGMNKESYSRQLVGLANWIQYVARINYVIVLLLISYSFEVLDMGAKSLKLISLSFFISFFISVSIIFFDKARRIVHCFITPLIFFTYRDLVNETVKVKRYNIIFSKPMLISLVSSTLLGLALVLPFLLADRYPEYRMMATYSGQFLNFFASAIIFSTLEPIMYKELDHESSQGVLCASAYGIIVAKTIAQIFLAVLVFALI